MKPAHESPPYTGCNWGTHVFCSPLWTTEGGLQSVTAVVCFFGYSDRPPGGALTCSVRRSGKLRGPRASCSTCRTRTAPVGSAPVRERVCEWECVCLIETETVRVRLRESGCVCERAQVLVLAAPEPLPRKMSLVPYRAFVNNVHMSIVSAYLAIVSAPEPLPREVPLIPEREWRS